MANILNGMKKIKNDIIHKTNIKKNQERYNQLLTASKYNRKVGDYRANVFTDAGQRIQYQMSSTTGKIKYLWGYNFNHTLSCLYLNYNNKLNLIKIQKIIDKFVDEYRSETNLWFMTLTMPNLTAKVENKDEHTELIKKANQTITNLYKQLEIKFGTNTMIKKYEITFKYIKGTPTSHPHFHILLNFKDDVRVLKDLAGGETVRSFVLNYWYKNFISKNFENISFNDAEASFDLKKCDMRSLNLELAGYISKNNKYDYLISQEIFDYAYTHMHNKRILTYSGIFKEINKELKLDQIEEIEDLEEDNEQYDVMLTFYFEKKNQNYGFSHVNVRNKQEFDENNKDRPPGLDNSTSSSKNTSLEIENLVVKEFTENWTEQHILELSQELQSKSRYYKNYRKKKVLQNKTNDNEKVEIVKEGVNHSQLRFFHYLGGE